MRKLVTGIAALWLGALSIPVAEGETTPPSVSEHTTIAIEYIRRISSGPFDIAKDTALSEHCSLQRRRAIRERIDFLKSNYFREGDKLTVEDKKVLGDLAGILIRAENPAAPLSINVHPVALIKKGDHWKPAPLPGLFANTGYGYDPEIEKSVQSLERWMSRQKTLYEDRLRKKATSEFIANLTVIENKTGFDNMQPQEAVEHFLEQCREKNLFGILASMGAASDALAEPMETTIQVISQGLANQDTENDWHLVTSRSVIAQVMKIDDTRNEVAVGFYNALDRGKSKVLYFPIHKEGNKTFVRLSPLLKINLLPRNEQWQHKWRHRRGDERELSKQLPAAIFKNNLPVSHLTPEKLLEHFLKSLKNNDFTDGLRLIPRKGAYFSAEENHTRILSDLGTMWKSLYKLQSSSRRTFDILKEGNVALAPLQYARTNRTGEFVTIKVWMIRDDDGWHLISSDALDENIGTSYKNNAAKVSKRFLGLEKKQKEKHARDLLDKVVTINPPLNRNAVEEDEAKKLFTGFRSHLRTNDTQAALSSCAVLKGTSSAQTLKTFNYALRGAADHTDDDQILGVIRKGKWLGLSVRTRSKLVELHDYPLYLIANTEKGARILIDIDLRRPTNKGREILNKKNWRKLAEALPADSLADIKAIYQEHLKLTEKDVAAVLKLRE